MSKKSLKKACKEIIKPSVNVHKITKSGEGGNTKFRIEYLDKCNLSSNNLQLINFNGSKPDASINFKDFTLHYSKKDNEDLNVDHTSYINYFKNIISNLKYNFTIEGNYIVSDSDRYHIREIKDIYNFYEKYRNKDNLTYFMNKINSSKITRNELKTNFEKNNIKQQLKINQVMLIYFHKNIINWYKNSRTGLNIHISPNEFIQMCLLPVFRPFVITNVRTKFSEFYKKNIELFDNFVVLDNMYSTNEKNIDMIHRANIDDLLKRGDNKIKHNKDLVLKKFDEFSETVYNRIGNITKYINEKTNLLNKVITENTYLHNQNKRYQSINFFNVLNDSLPDMSLLQKDINKFNYFQSILNEELQKVFIKIKTNFDIIKKNYNVLRVLHNNNESKNVLLNMYIYHNIQKNFSIMFKNNSLKEFKNNISVTLNDESINITTQTNFKQSLACLFSTKDKSFFSDGLNFSYTNPRRNRKQTPNFKILNKSDIKYNSYKTHLIFPQNLLNLDEPGQSIEHSENVPSDQTKSSIQLTINLEKEEFYINTIINKKNVGNVYMFDIEEEKKMGYSAVNAYIEYLLEIYVIQILNRKIDDDKFILKNTDLIRMIENKEIKLNSVVIFDTGKYKKTFKKETEIYDSKDRTSSFGTRRGQQSVPNNTSLEAINPLGALYQVCDDDVINKLLKDTDLNHYHKLYLLLCIFYSLKKTKSYSTIFFISKQNKKVANIDVDYNNITITIKKIKAVLNTHSNAPDDISKLMTEYLNEFKSIKYKIKTDISGNKGDKRHDKVHDKRNKRISLFRNNDIKHFSDTAIEILYKYKLPLYSGLNEKFYNAEDNPAIDFKDYVYNDKPSNDLKEKLTFIKNFVILLEHVQFGSLPDSIRKYNKIRINYDIIRSLSEALESYLFYDNELENVLLPAKKYIKLKTANNSVLNGIASEIVNSFVKFFKEDNKQIMDGGTRGRQVRKQKQKQKEVVQSEYNYLRLKSDINITDKFYIKNKEKINLMVEFINNLNIKPFNIFKFQKLYKKIKDNTSIFKTIVVSAKKIIPQIYINIINYNLNEKFNLIIDRKSDTQFIDSIDKPIYRSYSYYPDVIVPITKCLSDLFTVYERHDGTVANHRIFERKLKSYKYIYKKKLNIYKIYHDNNLLYSKIQNEGINMKYNYQVTNKYLEYLIEKFRYKILPMSEFIEYIIENIPSTYTYYSNLSTQLKIVTSIFLTKFFKNYKGDKSDVLTNLCKKLYKYIGYLAYLIDQIRWVFIDIFREKNDSLSTDIKETIIDRINNIIFNNGELLDAIFDKFDVYEQINIKSERDNIFSNWLKNLIRTKLNDSIDELILSIGQEDKIFNEYKESIANLNSLFTKEIDELDIKCKQYDDIITKLNIRNRKHQIDDLYTKLKNNNIDKVDKVDKLYKHINQLVNVENIDKVKILDDTLIFLDGKINDYVNKISRLRDIDSILNMTLQRKKELFSDKKKSENRIKFYIDKLKKMKESKNNIDELIKKIKNIDELFQKFNEIKKIWENFKSMSKINKTEYIFYTDKYDVTKFNKFKNHDLTKYAYLIDHTNLKGKFKKITSIPYKYFHIVNKHYNLTTNVDNVICYSIFNESIVLSKISDNNNIDVLEPIKIIKRTDPTEIIEITDEFFIENSYLYIDFLFLYYINKLFPQSIYHYENSKGVKKLYLWDSVQDKSLDKHDRVNRIVTNLKDNSNLMEEFKKKPSSKSVIDTSGSKIQRKKKRSKKSEKRSTKFKYKFQFVDI